MTIREIAQRVSAKTNMKISRELMLAVTKGLYSVIREELIAGNLFALTGIGTLKPFVRKQRTVFHAIKREKIHVEATKTVKLLFSKKLKKYINETAK